MNHMKLQHPHIIGLREVRTGGCRQLLCCRGAPPAALQAPAARTERQGTNQLLRWRGSMCARCRRPRSSAPAPQRMGTRPPPACLPARSTAAPTGAHPPPRALQVFLTSTHLVLAMEYAAGGDLAHYTSVRRGLGEEEARWFFQQIMIAVDYCHRMVRAAAERCCSGGCGAWGTVCAAHGWVDFPLMRPASWLSLCRRA